MKNYPPVLCLLFFFFTPGLLLSGAPGMAENQPLEDTGIILSAADFWIGLPDERNAMPFLKISEGTKVRVLELEKGYYKVEHRNMVGYVNKDLVKVIEAEALPLEAEELVSRGPEPADNSKRAEPAKNSAQAAGTLLFSLTQATSLRAQPDSKARVVLRFSPGDEVQVLESTDKYWWKVKFRGETGWAKCALLKKQLN